MIRREYGDKQVIWVVQAGDYCGPTRVVAMGIEEEGGLKVQSAGRSGMTYQWMLCLGEGWCGRRRRHQQILPD